MTKSRTYFFMDNEPKAESLSKHPVMEISEIDEEKIKEQMNKKIADSIKCKFPDID